MQGIDFRQSDEQVIQAAVAKLIKVKDGKLYIKGKLQKITLPGEDGKTPVKGVDYKDGEAGYTPVKGKDYRDGLDGKTPKKGVDYFDGLDGKTPKKGVDYFDGEPGKNAKTPAHKWNGTCLSFQNPDGTWGEEADLRGIPGESVKGAKGDIPEHEWRGTLLRVQKTDGSWSKWVDLKGETGRGKPGKTPRKGIDYKDGEKGDKADKAELPEAETIVILEDVNQVVGETGKVALEKKFRPIKVVRLK